MMKIHLLAILYLLCFSCDSKNPDLLKSDVSIIPKEEISLIHIPNELLIGKENTSTKSGISFFELQIKNNKNSPEYLMFELEKEMTLSAEGKDYKPASYYYQNTGGESAYEKILVSFEINEELVKNSFLKIKGDQIVGKMIPRLN